MAEPATVEEVDEQLGLVRSKLRRARSGERRAECLVEMDRLLDVRLAMMWAERAEPIAA